MKVHVMTLGKENKNGRIYTEESFYYDLDQTIIPIETSNEESPHIDLSKVVGEAILTVENDTVYADDINIFDAPISHGVGALLEQGTLSLAMKLTGVVGEAMYDCQPISLCCVSPDSKA